MWVDAGEEGQQALAAAAMTPEGAILPPEITPATLDRLERLDLLEQKDGKCRVQVELTRRWFARQARLTSKGT